MATVDCILLLLAALFRKEWTAAENITRNSLRKRELAVCLLFDMAIIQSATSVVQPRPLIILPPLQLSIFYYDLPLLCRSVEPILIVLHLIEVSLNSFWTVRFTRNCWTNDDLTVIWYIVKIGDALGVGAVKRPQASEFFGVVGQLLRSDLENFVDCLSLE